MPFRETPLDEIQWRSPEALTEMSGLHSNTILHYFSRSPFFDETSNNAILTNQALNNMNMYHLIQTREAFEGRLKTMSGLEYVVAQEPAEMGPGMGTGVWIIRKQTRTKNMGYERNRIKKDEDAAKHAGYDTGYERRWAEFEGDDMLEVHGCYFISNENIYMAPTSWDVAEGKLVSTDL